MATPPFTPPFPTFSLPPLDLIQGFAERAARQAGPMLEPVAQELRRRLVLLLNHVLLQEPEACARLARQKGRVVEVAWRDWRLALVATPAGLLDLAGPGAPADLTLTLTDESPWALAQSALQGEKPAVRISGDVMLAAEVNWLADHVRWDLEDDLARLVGDAPAHVIAAGARQAAQALRALAQRVAAGAASRAGDAR
jgi:ubiquinone biosynthesis protein UbiJ